MLGALRLCRRPVPPNRVQCHDHEPYQHPPLSPLVAYLLQESEHPVGPLDVVVGPHPPAHRILQVRHQLGELLRIQLLHRLGQFGHSLERRVTHDHRSTATGLLGVVGCVEQPVDPVGKPPERCQFGQVLQHPDQVVALRLGEVLPPLHDQVTAFEEEGRLLFDRHAAARRRGLRLGALAAPLLLAPGLAAATHRRAQPPDRVEDQLVDVLDDMEDAQLVVRVGPQFAQDGGVEVRAVGDHDRGFQPPGSEVSQEPPHVRLIIGSNQGEGDWQV